MLLERSNIFSELQKQIFSLQGFKSNLIGTDMDMGLGIIQESFPNNTFPLGAIHEFIGLEAGGIAAATGFVSGITSTIMRRGGASIWISTNQKIYPPALKLYGIDPDKIIFVNIRKEKDILWAANEALGCEGLAVVIAELPILSFVDSRKLQLAVEQSRVTGFILRRDPRILETTASFCRWKVNSLPSRVEENMPGVGFPRWNVELIKVRNGKPGNWQIEWKAESFHLDQTGLATSIFDKKRKTG